MTDREKLTDLIASYMEFVRTATPEEMATHLISNGVVVREKGEWVDHFVRDWRCSKCGEPIYKVRKVDGYCFDDKPNFCPNCGADMRRRENNG